MLTEGVGSFSSRDRTVWGDHSRPFLCDTKWLAYTQTTFATPLSTLFSFSPASGEKAGVRGGSRLTCTHHKPTNLHPQSGRGLNETPSQNKMTRIFVPLAILSILALTASIFLGLQIGNAASPSETHNISVHLLAGLGTLCFALLCHALVLTYLMGTGRWLEETCNAYHLDSKYQAESRRLKWRVYPWMTLCLLLLIATGAFGAAADPASAVGFKGWGSLSGANIHFLIAVTALTINVGTYGWEFLTLQRNGEIVNKVLTRVRQMREERGLPVE